ncbi:hypothetical protein LEN26_014334 [Aphanomyces euteiches]|nr:hypothetical protein LEN26_014334 [Aphanomyces euteiches]KAH9126786.1 hypothetical protein AeMF1_002798 [Aphanomyces euteiches]KAH9181123.1 hypothetical protein AeNC1_016902 [Aphanomyces euteiches]
METPTKTDLTVPVAVPPPGFHQREAKRRACILSRHHEIRYAVIVTDRAPGTNEPEVVHCLFCVHFGREVLSTAVRVRKPMKKVKTFKAPFRVDHFTQHHKIHHIERWEFYSGLTYDGKKSYFSSNPFHTEEVMVHLPPERLERLRGPYKKTTKCSTIKPVAGLVQAVAEPKPDTEETLLYKQQRHQAELEIAKKNLELKQIEVITSIMIARQKMLDAGVSQENVDRALPFPAATHIATSTTSDTSHSVEV